MSHDLYHELIIEEYKHPQNVGELSTFDLKISGSNVSCGDEVTIYIQFGKSGDQSSPITTLAWRGAGCAISQSAMSLLSQKILDEKMTLTQIKKLTKNDLLKLLGLETISSGRERCLMLGLETLKNQPHGHN